MTAQACLSLPWLQTLKTGFPVTRLIFENTCLFSILQLTTLDSLADSITQKGLSALRNVLVDHLKNVTLRKEVLGLADQIQNKSIQVRSDIKSIKHKVEKASLDKVIDVTEKAEFYR